jgi:hypothetical protein
MLFKERAICLQHTQLRDRVSLTFDPANNFADEGTGYAIWLNEDKCFF